ncbi:MAG: hypothetical protein WBA89_16925 [Microcoleus sp.]
MLNFVPKPQETSLSQVGDTLPKTIEFQVEKYNYSTGKTEIEKWELPVTVFEMEVAATKDLAAVLRPIQSGKVSVSEKTALPAGSVKAIASILQGGDFYNEEQRQITLAKDSDYDDEVFVEIGSIKPFAWIMIAQGSKFAERSGRKLCKNHRQRLYKQHGSAGCRQRLLMNFAALMRSKDKLAGAQMG